MSDSPVRPLSEIIPPGTNPLGFGCGGLVSDIGHRESLRLLETAIDCGITYFDTARMYGFGDAEGVLGKLLPRHRGNVIVASKAGILPASRSIPLRMLNRGIRLLHNVASPIASGVPAPSAIHPQFGQFRVLDIRKSIETSLKKMRTDYLDIFLLHECTEADVQSPELQYFLQSLQKDGKIRAFGLATGIEETIRIVNSRPYLSSILQIPNNIWNMNIKRLPSMAKGHTITHSTLTHRFHVLARQLLSDGLLAKQWRSALQIDPRNKESLAMLLLANALNSNPEGLVLFFSTKRRNIQASAKVATEARFDPAQFVALNALIRIHTPAA